jgi:hypothetical protein
MMLTWCMTVALLVNDPAPRWEGTLQQGLDELTRRIQAQDAARVVELADALLQPDRYSVARSQWLAAGGWRAETAGVVDPYADRLGLRALAPRLVSQLHLARADALVTLGRAAEARAAYELARADGAAEERLAAIDALVDLDMVVAEEARKRVVAPPEPDAKPAELMAAARKAYVDVRLRLIERLRLDPSDADARADAEWVQRRLEELKRLEEERKQQQNQQQKSDQQKQDEQKPNEQNQQDPNQQQEQKPDEQKPQQDPQQDAQQDQQQPQSKDAPKPEDARPLTKEEAQQLLDRLQDLDKKGEQLRQSLIKARREKVDKDW